MIVVISRFWAVRAADHAIVGRLMVLVVFEVIGHLVGCSRKTAAVAVGDPAVGSADLQKQDGPTSTEPGKTFYIAGGRSVGGTKARLGYGCYEGSVPAGAGFLQLVQKVDGLMGWQDHMHEIPNLTGRPGPASVEQQKEERFWKLHPG